MLPKNRRNLRRIQLGVKDPKRSFKLRSEGLMKKANDLRILGARVAIYIDGVIDGQHEELAFKTDSSFNHPAWNSLPASEQLGPDNFGLVADFEQLAPTTSYSSMIHTNCLPMRPPPSNASMDPAPRTPRDMAQPETEVDTSSSETPSRETSPQLVAAEELDDFAALFGSQSDTLLSSPIQSSVAATGSALNTAPSTPCSEHNRRPSTTSPWLEAQPSSALTQHQRPARRPFLRCQSSPLALHRSPKKSLSNIKWFED